MLIELQVNGQPQSAEVHPLTRLLDLLRHSLGLTGCKEGCGEGECGSCAVLLDGQLVHSCLVPALQVNGSQVTTIEGLGAIPLGARLQAAFAECGGAQCGICTPGMLLAAFNLLQQQPQPSLPQIQQGLSGNLCRCTGYTKIYQSVQRACQNP